MKAERYEIANNYENGIGVEKSLFKAYALYLQLAEEGYAPAQYSVGLAYFKNLFYGCINNIYLFTTDFLLPQVIESIQQSYLVDDNDELYLKLQTILKNNLIAAQKWLGLAAKQGYVDAIFLIGEMHLEGKYGGTQNIPEAKKYFQQAKEQGHMLAICKLAEIFAIENNLEQAIEFYKIAAQANCAAAQFNLGVRYEYGECVEKDQKLANTWILKSAEAGYPMAQYNLSMKVAQNDDSAAVAWCLKAAEGGYAAAQNKIGLMYEHGNGVQQDYKQAIMWYRKAAAQNWPAAQFNLAEIYNNTSCNIVGLDIFKAVSLYKKAALQGHLDASYALGEIYNILFHKSKNIDILSLNSMQLFMPENDPKYCFEKAVLWYTKAATQEHENAAYDLSMLYLSIKEDPKILVKINMDEVSLKVEAFKWSEIAAKQANHVSAQYNVAIMYLIGDGIKQQVDMANFWFQRAEINTLSLKDEYGDETVVIMLHTLCERLANIKKKLEVVWSNNRLNSIQKIVNILNQWFNELSQKEALFQIPIIASPVQYIFPTNIVKNNSVTTKDTDVQQITRQLKRLLL